MVPSQTWLVPTSEFFAPKVEQLVHQKETDRGTQAMERERAFCKSPRRGCSCVLPHVASNGGEFSPYLYLLISVLISDLTTMDDGLIFFTWLSSIH